MASKIIQIQFSTSHAFTSGIIRRMCHSPFSHCDLILPEEGLLGVSGPDKGIGDPGGVLIRRFDCWPYLRPPKVARLAAVADIVDGVVALARSQTGKPFDDGALWNLLSDTPGDRNWRDQSSWFCSELVTWALERGGFFPWQLISAKSRITPADLLLLLNPFMSAENIKEFQDD